MAITPPPFYLSGPATITGGSVNATPIGNTSPGSGAFTSFSTSGNSSIAGAQTVSGSFSAGITSVNDSSGGSASLVINATGVNGANIKFIGNGTTSPTKTLRTNAGNFQIINDAYSQVILSLDDGGNLSVSGNFTVSGAITSNGVVSSSYATVAAAGTTQGTATPVNSQFISIMSGASGAGVILVNPASGNGCVFYLVNQSASTKQIYPPSGALFSNSTPNTPTSLAVGSLTAIAFFTNGFWGILP